MIRKLVLLVVLIGCAISAPVESKEDMEDALINKFAGDFEQEMVKLMGSLSTEEKMILDRFDSLYTQDKNQDIEKYLEAIKAESPSLHEKMDKFFKKMGEQFKELPFNAKKFLETKVNRKAILELI